MGLWMDLSGGVKYFGTNPKFKFFMRFFRFYKLSLGGKELGVTFVVAVVLTFDRKRLSLKKEG